ncbi:MAG TPA: endo-1,4-beta-xylanase [Mycobacteriales bacterium]|nr:endo-1,4-beta-xylanase [Mycobacteriales bacterium]
MCAALAVVVGTLGLVLVSQRPGHAASTLRQLAEANGRYFGDALEAPLLTSNAAYSQVAGTQFDMATPGNEMKWDATEPSRGTFTFGAGDQIVAFAKAHDQRVRGHNLVWHSQLPGWLTSGTFSATELSSIMDNHIAHLVGHYAGQLYAWDVINEPFNEDGTMRASMWENTIGPGYIAEALRDARAADPTAKLYINDFNVEGINAKSDGLFNLVKSLKAQGVPIDGVGIQAHLILGQVPSTMQQNLQRFADLGVDVAITELDVRMNLPATPTMLTQQASDYAAVTRDCLAVARCVGITVWGVGDPDSWVISTFPGQGAPLLFDDNYQPKSAYQSVSDVLSAGAGLPPTSPPPTSPPPTTPPPTTPPPSSPGGCTVSYVESGWATGFIANIVIGNTGSTPIDGWTLSFAFSGNQQITNLWNGAPTQTGTSVTVRNLSYNEVIPPGGTTALGFQAAFSGTNTDPTAFSVNGVACTTG